MRYGIYLSNFGEAISARSLADLAEEAERAGWDGFFLCDHILGSKSSRLPMVDPWVALAAWSGEGWIQRKGDYQLCAPRSAAPNTAPRNRLRRDSTMAI